MARHATSQATPPGEVRLAVLCTAPLTMVLDTTVVTIALPSIADDLGFTGVGVSWVLTGHALVFGGLLLLGGRLGDLWGHRRMFRIGFLVFAVASVIGGLAHAPWVLLVARVLQGAAAAVVMPTSLALVTLTLTEEHRRSRALGIYSGTAAVGGALGVVLGGVLTEFLGWRWVMFAVAPMALPALLDGGRREEPGPRGKRKLDAVGAVTVTAGLAAILYVLTEGHSLGWRSPTAVVTAAVGLLLLTAFLVVERHAATPLVPLPTLLLRPVGVSNLAFLIRAANAGYALVLTVYFQSILGLSPLATGFCFLPLMIAAIVAAPASGRWLVPRLGRRVASMLGMGLQGLGLVLMALGVHTDTVSLSPITVMLGSVVWAVGKVMADVAMTITATEPLRAGGEGLAAGLVSTSQQLGAAWGFAVAAAILAGFGGPGSIAGPAVALLANAGFIVLAVGLVVVALPDEASYRRTG